MSKITKLSTFTQTLTGDRHLIQLSEHQKYGPIVRIGPNSLSFSSPKALREIYQSGKETNPLRKSESYETIDAPSGALSIHTEISCQKHASRRRVLDYAFSTAALRSNEPYIIETAERLCQVLSSEEHEEWSAPRNMSDYATWFAYDVMGALVFGQEFECLTDISHRYVPQLIIGSSAFLYAAGSLPFQWLVRPVISSPKLMKLLGSESAREEHAYVEYANARVSDRLAQENTCSNLEARQKPARDDERRDMMHYIINARDPDTGKGYSRSEIDADSSLLIAAGSDTSSTVLAALFFYLTIPSSNSILQKLTSEIRDHSKFPEIKSIAGSATTSLPYLRACIDEALRLAPPVPSHLPRTVAQRSGVQIDGHMIPHGITVGAPAYVVHHNESVYPDSWAFRPERWIVDSSSSPETKIAQVKHAKEAFASFSFGSRGCIGKDLAYRELCICVARILYRYDIRRAETTDGEKRRRRAIGSMRGGLVVRDDEFQLIDCFLAGKDGPDVQFRKVRTFI